MMKLSKDIKSFSTQIFVFFCFLQHSCKIYIYKTNLISLEKQSAASASASYGMGENKQLKQLNLQTSTLLCLPDEKEEALCIWTNQIFGILEVSLTKNEVQERERERERKNHQ